MKVLVGGGSGHIGRHLRKALEKNGHEVINIGRTMKSSKDLTWTGLERNGLPKGVDSIVNLAGTNIMSPVRWTDRFKEDVISSRLSTTKTIVDIVKKSDHKPRSFVSASAVGFYGYEDKGTALTENSPKGHGFAADLCQMWEQAANEMDKDVRTTIIRIGLALSGDGGMMATTYWPFYFGVGGMMGDGKQWFPWIHSDDVAGIIRHSITNSSISGVLNAVAPDYVTNAEFTKILSRSMWRFAPFPVPNFVLQALFGDDRAKIILNSPKVIPQRTLESGYKFLYPDLKAACDDCIKWK